ncbi:DUF6318 family protein [Nocardioides daeguensis]|uniref:DUF6318 domain-containing protein n=1 Tax=Nocardioides daeguensis TaxID=908359 RepID=A0ABP6UVM5_9ACTN|nr:DUF6318 family protein [Nocardioides daeguensis]MBV6728145.1 hypothetical protein [Nocardioides daeguensis]MCR1772955.1 hypothetical protein [Nocardioides daeguensis]
MRTTSRVAALTLSLSVALATLTACSDDDPPAADPSPTWSPTGTMESPTTSSAAAPVEPELPVEATEASEAGARAFIAYYWELINYAQVTGDVKGLRAASGKSCEGCNAGLEAIRSLYEGGGHIQGGQYTPVVVKLNRLQGKGLTAFEALLTVTNVEQVVLDGDGSEHRSAAGSASVAVACQWSAGTWHMEVMDQQ